jgi:polysaccharide export outer membrane protein
VPAPQRSPASTRRRHGSNRSATVPGASSGWAHCTAALLLLAGCAGGDAYVRVEDFPGAPAAPAGPYLIAEGDLLSIRVFGQEGLSGSVRVRSDGKISLPFVNEQQAARLTPATLGALLQASLKTFLVNPVVAVSLEERHASQVSVLGNVAQPGLYPLQPGSGVLRAVAQAGGLGRFADQGQIYVLRADLDRPGRAGVTKIRFTWQALVSGQGPAAAFELREGDVVFVE